MDPKRRKNNNFKRNHKAPLLAIHENPRYTGVCQVGTGCAHCMGEVPGSVAASYAAYNNRLRQLEIKRVAR